MQIAQVHWICVQNAYRLSQALGNFFVWRFCVWQFLSYPIWLICIYLQTTWRKIYLQLINWIKNSRTQMESNCFDENWPLIAIIPIEATCTCNKHRVLHVSTCELFFLVDAIRIVFIVVVVVVMFMWNCIHIAVMWKIAKIHLVPHPVSLFPLLVLPLSPLRRIGSLYAHMVKVKRHGKQSTSITTGSEACPMRRPIRPSHGSRDSRSTSK